MARGVIKKWKQPVSFTLCAGGTHGPELKVQLYQVISALQDIGLDVIGTVCDQATANVACVNSLIKENKEKHLRDGREVRGHYFEVNSKIVVPIYYVPHLIKGDRNNLLTRNLLFKINNKDMTASWDHIVETYNIDMEELSEDLRMLPKLTRAHIEPVDSQKMKVSFCTQVFSQRVASTINFLARHSPTRLSSEAEDLASLLLFFDKLFDSVNGSKFRVPHGKPLKGPLKTDSAHAAFWEEAIKVLNSMVFVSKNDPSVKFKVPSLNIWIVTIRGFQLIWKELKAKGIKPLFLRNLNQDTLENFFGSIRSHGVRNINPSSSALIAAYKTLLLNNFLTSHSVGGNCEEDICEGALTSLHELFKMSVTVLDEEDLNMREEILEINETGETLQISNYCCGYILNKIKEVTYNCINCKNDLYLIRAGIQHGLIEAREYSSHNSLTHPSFSASSCFIKF